MKPTSKIWSKSSKRLMSGRWKSCDKWTRQLTKILMRTYRHKLPTNLSKLRLRAKWKPTQKSPQNRCKSHKLLVFGSRVRQVDARLEQRKDTVLSTIPTQLPKISRDTRTTLRNKKTGLSATSHRLRN